MRIDAHISFVAGRYLPEHVEYILKRNRFDGAVAIQHGPGLDELRWLLQLSDQHDFIKAVVARADVPDLPVHPKLKAIWTEGLPSLPALLPVDACVSRAELAAVARAVDAEPEMRIALTRAHLLAPWGPELDELAGNPRVYAKLSGMIDHDGLGDFVPRLLSSFGPDRVMFGSDWPRCLQRTERWKQTLAVFTQAIGARTMEFREKVLGNTPLDFYRIASLP